MKRIFAFLLAMVMVLGMYPATTLHVHAEEAEEFTQTEETDPEETEETTETVPEDTTVTEKTSAPTTEETESATTVPETRETEPVTTVPETKETEPETTVPETEETEPATTVPETKETEPATTVPETEETIAVNTSDVAIETPDIPEGLTYIISNNSVTITGYTGTATELVIPNTIEKYPVISIGRAAFSGCTSLKAITFPSSLINIEDYAFRNSGLNTVMIPDNVVSIGHTSFGFCGSLRSVEIGGGISKIDSCAFQYCNSLQSLILPSNVTEIGSYAFEGCSNLQDITLPSTLKTIGRYAFSKCSGLTGTLCIPDSVNTIYDNAFQGCSLLTGIEIGENASISSNVFFECGRIKNIVFRGYPIALGSLFGENSYDGAIPVTQKYTVYYLPSGLESVTIYQGAISSDIFENCTNIKYVVLEDGVSSIGDRAFYNCTGLMSLTGENVSSIGDYAFCGCTELINVNLGEKLQTLGNAAFMDCSSLTNICLGAEIREIGESAFSRCTALESVMFGHNICYIGDGAFSQCDNIKDVYVTNANAWCTLKMEGYIEDSNPVKYESKLHIVNEQGDEVNEVILDGTITEIRDEAFKNCVTLTSVTIPESVRIIGESAFYGCEKLEKIKIPNSVDEIEMFAFACCGELKEAVLGDGVTIIGLSAFRSSGLEKITFGENVQYIDSFAFSFCGNLSDVTILNEGVTIGREAFSYCGNLTNVLIRDGEIGESAFYKCIKLKSFTLSAGSVGDVAFEDCAALTTVSISNASIGIGAFLNCKQLQNVMLNDGVWEIREGAFGGCVSLREITIPKSVSSIGSAAFCGCSNLESITLPFVGDSRKGETDRYQYPLGYIFGAEEYENAMSVSQTYHGSSTSRDTSTQYYIPKSLEKVTITGGNINSGAFDRCEMIKNISLPSGIEYIGERAFERCYGLQSVTIPSSVSRIKDSAFSLCNRLSDVYYAGTQAQWDAISIGSENDCLTNATLHFTSAVKITKQPVSVCMKKGETAKVTVKATGDGLSYQWYFKNPSATKFSKSSTTTASYSVKMSNAVSGRQVYCVVKDSYGNSVKTNTVTLDQVVTITTQPKNTCVAKGTTAKVTVKAVGKDLTYQWYFKNPTATKFSKSSTTTASYSVKMSNAVSSRQVYCVVKDSYGNSVKTNTVTLDQVVTITTQPKNTCVAKGTTAKVTIKAVGKDLTYQWYFKNPSATKFSKSSNTTSTYSVKMSNAVSGRQVYCVVKDSYGNSVKTNTVTLDQVVTITTQPKNVSVAKGTTAKVTVTAVGKDLTYQWYFKNPSATKYSKSSNTTSSYSVKMSAAVSGRQVYCVVKDSYGNTVKTNVATLKMK